MIFNSTEEFLMHHGVKGQKWGVRRSPEELGYRNRHHSKTDRGGDKERTVFISGSVKVNSIPENVKNNIRKEMKKGSRFIIGDAPGIDTAVQKFLADEKYKKVDIYTVMKKNARNNADDGKLGWNVKNVDASRYEEGTPEWQATKDTAMINRSDTGIAVVIPNGASKTRNNAKRLIEQNKKVKMYTTKP